MLGLHVVMRMEGEKECILGIMCRESSQTICFGLDRVWVKASLLPGFVTSDELVDFLIAAAALVKWERYHPIGIWGESKLGGTSYVPGSMPVLEES